MTGRPGAPSVPLAEIVTYLDEFLEIRDVPDAPTALNGLQVENTGRIGSLVAAVDASQATIDGVIEEELESGTSDGGAPLLLVHHGLFWDGNVPVTGRRYRRLSALLEHDIALYSAHLPLDLHPVVGNNAVLAERLGIAIEGWFGETRGRPIGVWGQIPAGLAHRDALRAELGRAVGAAAPGPMLIAGGPERIARVGIITGGAGSAIAAARDAGLDTFITGEGPHHTYFDAMEWGLNVFYAGHYATETLGVQALASHLSDRFELPWAFHDHPTGM